MAYTINQKICSCCHRCELECPAEAIRMNFSKYWIDPNLCTNCGHCATVCHNAAISDPENPHPAAVPHEKVKMDCDVLVIGGGGSGLTSAAKAADIGKSVILMEKNWEVGGSAYFGHMMRVIYSKWHEAEGIEDQRERMYNTFVRKTQGRANAELFRRLLDANVDLANWLIDAGEMEKYFKMGPGRFGGKDLVDNFEFPLNALRSDPSIGPGASGSAICWLLRDMFLERGGTILLNTQATRLLLDDSGAVIGVLASDPGGEVEVRCKSVVVAAGAFTRNKEIMDKMQPLFYDDEGQEPVHIYTCATCTGDGITMCDEIGADIDYENRRVNLFGPMHHPFSYSVLSMIRSTSGVTVNKLGEPIEQGGMTEVSSLVYEPGRIAWTIVDQKTFDESIEANKESTDPDTRMSYEHWERDLNNEIRDGSVIKADSMEELADKLGFDKKKFLDFIIRHNQDVAEGKLDMPFGPPPGDGGDDEDNFMAGMMMDMPKPHPLVSGPFYAVFMKLFHENSVGGMTIDENGSVLKNGRPIPGLYAAGDNTRGIMLPGEIGVLYIEGAMSAMTYAMSSGYLSCLNAVEYSNSKS